MYNKKYSLSKPLAGSPTLIATEWSDGVTVVDVVIQRGNDSPIYPESIQITAFNDKNETVPLISMNAPNSPLLESITGGGGFHALYKCATQEVLQFYVTLEGSTVHFAADLDAPVASIVGFE